VASSWILFFSYQDEARSSTHQIMEQCLKIATPTIRMNVPLLFKMHKIGQLQTDRPSGIWNCLQYSVE